MKFKFAKRFFYKELSKQAVSALKIQHHIRLEGPFSLHGQHEEHISNLECFYIIFLCEIMNELEGGISYIVSCYIRMTYNL